MKMEDVHQAFASRGEHDAPMAQLMVRATIADAIGFSERLGSEDVHTVVLGEWLVAAQ